MAAREDWSNEAGRVVTVAAEFVVGLAKFVVGAVLYLLLGLAALGALVFFIRQV